MTKGLFCVRLDVHTWRRVTLLAVLTLLPFTPLLEHADVGAPHVAYAQGAPAVYVVTSTDDSAIDRLECLDVESHCSLRGAIQAANAHAGNDTIRFRFATSCGAICTINLNSPLPDIIDSLTITWLGPENLVIRRNKDNNSTTLTDYYRVFTIRGDITVSLTGLFISNGFAKVVHPNTSTEGDEASGGGILIRDATVTITNCVIGSNAAEFRGGGITNYRGTLTVVESEIVNNSNGPTGLGEPTGGGIYTSNLLFVRRSAILTNDTFGRGGGIVAFGPDANVNVENSTISGNTALHGDGSGGGPSDP